MTGKIFIEVSQHEKLPVTRSHNRSTNNTSSRRRQPAAVSSPDSERMARKKEERSAKVVQKKEKKQPTSAEADEGYVSFRSQLAKLGLQLREITGDGCVHIFTYIKRPL